MSTVYRGLTFMLTKRRRWLNLYLLMDTIICVIVILLKIIGIFKINGCDQLWFLEVIYIASIHWGHGCWLLVRVERWLLLGGL